jgi:anti-sigma factor RsiW
MAGSAATVLVILAGNLVLGGVRGDSLAAEAVKDHVQASLNERQIEIASSDQHTVKPWLSARLDYSPPVRDLADEGFALAGGRLDTLAGQRVATLVYRYRLHTIDVFVRPQPAAAPAGPHSLRGFNVAHASASGMDYLAVSDVSAEVLGQFVQRLAAQAAGP